VDLHDIADVSQIMGGLALFVSVLFLFFEVRENNRLTRAANNQALVELSSPFNQALIQDRKMAELYVRGAEQYPDLDDVDQYRYRSLLSWWLILHENIYYQWRRGLLDHRSFKPWASELKVFVKQQQLERVWGEMRNLFQDQFACHIDRLLAGDSLSGQFGPFPKRREDRLASGGREPPVPRSPRTPVG
jgi:hypothetical protein